VSAAPEDEPRAHEALAGELRRLLRRLNERRPPEAAVRLATERVRELHDLLDGPPRARWFEDGVADGRSSRLGRQRFSEYSLFRGRSSAIAPPMSTEIVHRPDGAPAIRGTVVVPRLYEGPPNGVHGGYVAGLFDDILGGSQALIEGPSGLTGTLSVRYRHLTPLDTELVLLAWVHHVSGRRIVARATCSAGDVVTAEAEALFVRVDMAALAQRRRDYRPGP
jgi:acyl-coenzyme A thioesterase PaaI-like protein